MIDEPRKYTEKQSAFLDALMSEAKGNIRKAMDMAGYEKTATSTHVVSSLRNEIIDRASMVLALNSTKAAFGLVDVLDDPTSMGARNSISAASQVLDRVGIVKKEQVEVKNTGGALFILPPKEGTDEVA
jgi:hypothetical protein